jgi:hypothetical protein
VADLVSEGSPPARSEQSKPLARPRPEPNVPRHRFGLAYLILAAILGAAVGLFIVLTAGGGKHSSPPWSAWKPEKSGVQRLNEIARHVEGQYALPNGRKLVIVLSTPLEVQSQNQPVPLRAIGVAPGLAGESASDATFYDASSGWAFNFCGEGSKCALPGTASQARYALLQREALELALYTFKYEPAIDSVVAYLPPAKKLGSGSAANTAIFLRRQDLAPALKDPLSRTLPPPKGVLRPGALGQQELERVKTYTGDRIYDYAFQSLQDGTVALLLEPLSGS